LISDQNEVVELRNFSQCFFLSALLFLCFLAIKYVAVSVYGNQFLTLNHWNTETSIFKQQPDSTCFLTLKLCLQINILHKHQLTQCH